LALNPLQKTPDPARREKAKKEEVKVSKASKGKEVQLRCMRCQQWVTHPIGVKNVKSIDVKELSKTLCQCPRCGDMASCTIKNLRVLDENGKLVDIDG